VTPQVRSVAVRDLAPGGGRVTLPEEVPVALVFNGTSVAVMMATPADLADFAWGFALSEGIAGRGDLGGVEVVAHGHGIEARMWLPDARAEALASRRRAAMGPVGCGLCGIDSLDAALRPLPPVGAGIRMGVSQIAGALDELRGWQPLHDETRAVHAAGFWQPDAGIVMAREDVGRHNALDKLIGGLARAGIDAATGAIVLTSRMSVEMVQKTAQAGAATLVSVSAPTAHAVRLATGAGMTVASRLGGSVRVWSRADRIGGTDG